MEGLVGSQDDELRAAFAKGGKADRAGQGEVLELVTGFVEDDHLFATIGDADEAGLAVAGCSAAQAGGSSAMRARMRLRRFSLGLVVPKKSLSLLPVLPPTKKERSQNSDDSTSVKWN